MIKVEFLRDYKCCWKKGDTRKVLPHFAAVLIENGIAKRVREPKKDKMIKNPPMEKSYGNL